MKILLVDDDDICLTLERIVIERMYPDSKIYTKECGKDAIEFLANQSVDLIFLDLLMPDMDGWSVLKQLKSRGILLTNVFVVTSSINSRDSDEAEKNPSVSGLISKPLFDEDIKEAMEKVVLNPGYSN